MPSHSEYQERVDVLDLIISVLKDHEETLTKLADRFGVMCDDMSAFHETFSTLDRVLARLDKLKVRSVVEAGGSKSPLVTVKCRDWLAFKAASQGALLVAFDVSDDRCVFSSVSDLFVFTFADDILGVKMLLEGRIGRWIKRIAKQGNLNAATSSTQLSSEGRDSVCELLLSPQTVRQWLSSELEIAEEKIVEGQVIR